MDRRKFLGSAGVVAAAAAASSLPAPAIAQSNPKISWNLASSFPKSLDTIHGAADVLSARVAEATEGAFEIAVKAPGELVPAFEVRKAVTSKTVQCCHTASYYFTGDDPTFAFDTSLPFGLNARSQVAWMFEGGGLEAMNKFYAEYNIRSFPMGNTGVQMGGWWRKEVKSLADLQGVKMRIAGLGGRVMQAIGASPQQIPGAEIYQSLEKGVIDAAEWVGPYDDEKLGFYKVAPFYYFPGWWEGGPQLSLFVNTEEYAALPKHYQAILTAAAHEANTIMMARYDARNPTALKKLLSAGAQLRPYPDDVMQAAFDASSKLYEEFNASNPKWKAVWDTWQPFRQDAYAWFGVNEAAFDRFMVGALRR